MNEDFFSYTYISMLSHVHLLVVLFQTSRNGEQAAKNLESDTATQSYESAKKEMASIHNNPNSSENLKEMSQ